ncbi:carbohydrate binding domain protein [Sugiyamaella lignohabitans]|uniref:Carbohydrate binding domain protein n=1 Tax=Sugiyamaella lignohabitans TaxID=796027 RepID=A0A161HN87_9ASCO|nr:carbohydrate binding domain protein [Sugiyamaella lignohabitans]ANB15547.1 carbohydrate binding domain protein [Sugiyamaella lignohabitans]
MSDEPPPVDNPTPENPTPENPTPENPTPENPTPEPSEPATPGEPGGSVISNTCRWVHRRLHNCRLMYQNWWVGVNIWDMIFLESYRAERRARHAPIAKPTGVHLPLVN